MNTMSIETVTFPCEGGLHDRGMATCFHEAKFPIKALILAVRAIVNSSLFAAIEMRCSGDQERRGRAEERRPSGSTRNGNCSRKREQKIPAPPVSRKRRGGGKEALQRTRGTARRGAWCVRT